MTTHRTNPPARPPETAMFARLVCVIAFPPAVLGIARLHDVASLNYYGLGSRPLRLLPVVGRQT